MQAVLWSALQGWGGQLIGLGVYLLLARLLGPRDFGLIAMAFVFIAFTQVFVEQGLSAALIQKEELEDNHISTAFWSNSAAGLILMMLGIASAELIANFFKEPELEPIIRILSLLLFINSLGSVQSALLRKELRFKAIAIRTLSGLVIGANVGVTMALKGYGVYSLVGQQIAGSIVQVILLWVISDWRPSFSFSFQRFKELYAYGLNVLGINLLEFFNRYSDNLLIGYYLGPVLLGYYAIAYRLYQVVTQLLTGLSSQVLFSSFSKLKSDTARLCSAFYSVVELTAVFAFPILIVLFVLANDVITIVFGSKWETSVPIFQVFMVVALIESVYFYNGSLMMAMGKPSWRLKLNLINAIVNFIGFYIAVNYGILYVAIAYTLRTYLLSPLPLRCVKALIHISYKDYMVNLALPLLFSLQAGLLLYLFRSNLLGDLPYGSAAVIPVALYLLVNVGIYFVVIKKIKPSTFDQIENIFKPLLKRRSA